MLIYTLSRQNQKKKLFLLLQQGQGLSIIAQELWARRSFRGLQTSAFQERGFALQAGDLSIKQPHNLRMASLALHSHLSLLPAAGPFCGT